MSGVRRAVILAAGRGSRLGHITAAEPKPLLLVAGQSLLERQIVQMLSRGIEEITIVAGFGADLVRSAVSTAGRWGRHARLSVVENPDSATTGSARSLIVAGFAFTADEPVLLAHGDIIYAHEILDRCLEQSGATTAADRTWKRETGDEVLVWSRGGIALRLAKGESPGPQEHGEFIGLSVLPPEFALPFLNYCRDRVEVDPSLNYEIPLLSDFLPVAPMSCSVSYMEHVPWVNINVEADLLRARRDFENPVGTRG